MIQPVVNKEAVRRAVIKVVGVGGGGVNAINTMIAAGVKGVDFIAMNTDVQHLEGCLADQVLELAGLTQGMGAGGDPNKGREAALQARESIENLLRGANMVIITAVFGGGTGTGAATVVAEVARSLGILTVAVITLPFSREGEVKMREALKWLDTLKGSVDAYAVIPNDNLKKLAPRGTPSRKVLQLLDQYLGDTLTALVELITHRAIINPDLNDVRAALQNSGRFLIGVGLGEGEDRAEVAIQRALKNPLLENTDIRGAQNGLIYIVQGPDGSDDEVDVVMNRLWEYLARDARIKYGWDENPQMEGRIAVTVILSNLNDITDVDATSLVEVEEPGARAYPLDSVGLTNFAARPSLSDQAGLDRARAQRSGSRSLLNDARRPGVPDEAPELNPVPAFMRAKGRDLRLHETSAPSELGTYFTPGLPGSSEKRQV